jgi:GNAT superfamily N-acetyltransferase
MGIIYNDLKKDLPSEQLHELFVSVGWSDGSETPKMIELYNVPFINSTLVISAWEGGRLIGAVRVLSDKRFRSIIYDLLVLPEFQGRGVGRELVKRCIEHFPSSEWLVQTVQETAGFYEKNGFSINAVKSDIFLTIPCKLFTKT